MKRSVLILLPALLALWSSCGPKAGTPEDSLMRRSAQPFAMNGDTATLFLRDYFMADLSVETCEVDGPIDARVEDQRILLHRNAPSERSIHILTIRAAGLPYTILLDFASEGGPLQLIPTEYSESEVVFEAPGSDSLYAFWEHFQLKVERQGNRYSVGIPLFAKDLGRSCIRAIAFTKERRSRFLEVPLRKGKVISKTSKLKHTDWQHAVVHQLVLNGSSLRAFNQRMAQGYHDSLPFTSLLLPPLNKKGFLTGLDPRWGEAADLTGTVNLAHRSGLSVFLQLPPLLFSNTHALVLAHPDWFTTKDDSVYTARLDHPICAAFLADSVAHWVRTYELDGLVVTSGLEQVLFRVALRKQLDAFTAEMGRPILLLQDRHDGYAYFSDPAHSNAIPLLSTNLEWGLRELGIPSYDRSAFALSAPLIPHDPDQPWPDGLLASLSLRKKHMAGTYGSWELTQDKASTQVLRRRYFSEVVDVVTNRGTEAFFYEDEAGVHHEVPPMSDRAIPFSLK